MNVRVNIKGMDKAQKRMRERASNLRVNSKVFREIGEIASKSIKTNVESGGRPTWKPRKYKYSHPILNKTGTMRDKAELTALQNWTHSGRLHTKKISSTNYGFIHQYIGIKTDGKKVIRQFIIFQKDEIQAMADTIIKALTLE